MIVTIVLAAYFFSPTESKKPTPVAELPPALSCSSLNFGTAMESADFVFPAKLTNITSETVTVSRFATSCDCGRVEPKTVTLPPNTEITVDIHLDLTRRKAEERLSFDRSFEVPFVCQNAKGQALFSSKITGKIQSPLVLDCQDWSLGTFSELALPATGKVKDIDVKTNPDVESWKVKSATKGIEAESEGAGKTLAIFAPEKLPLGSHTHKVTIETKLKGKSEPILSEYTFKMEVTSDIKFSPIVTQLGFVEFGKTYPIEVRLVSLSGKNIKSVTFARPPTGLELAYQAETKLITGKLSINQKSTQKLEIPVEIQLDGIEQKLTQTLTIQYFAPSSSEAK